VESAEENDDETVEWKIVCSRLDVLASTRGENGEDWGRLLSFKDGDARVHEWAMPMEMLAGDGHAYRERLLSMGLIIEPGKKARERLHQYIASTMPTARARAVSRVGWHGGSFVLPDAVIGKAGISGDAAERILIQNTSALEHAFRASGGLEDWQREIASHCRGNSRLVFAVSAAFAPPLLYVLDEESGGFHFSGASTIGKTTDLIAAGSVWGGGGIKGYLRQWRATANGLEGVASLHCDTLLCLDEIAQVSAREAGEVAYMLANGQGKSRAHRDGSGKPPLVWRTLFMSTGELSLADKVAEDGRRSATAGQQLRVLDVPADAGGDSAFSTPSTVLKTEIFLRAILRRRRPNSTVRRAGRFLRK
jgi:putative DNA primase/helicase